MRADKLRSGMVVNVGPQFGKVVLGAQAPSTPNYVYFNTPDGQIEFRKDEQVQAWARHTLRITVTIAVEMEDDEDDIGHPQVTQVTQDGHAVGRFDGQWVLDVPDEIDPRQNLALVLSADLV